MIDSDFGDYFLKAVPGDAVGGCCGVTEKAAFTLHTLFKNLIGLSVVMAQSKAFPSIPYSSFATHRKPSTSSPNTRQRENYEQSQAYVSQPSPPRLTVTSSDGESDGEDGTRSHLSSSAIDPSFPASELPFASEPALETELETELPPLKKLRPTRFNGGVTEEDDFEDGCSQPKIIVTNAIKGILTKKEHSSPTASGSTSPTYCGSVSGPINTTPPPRHIKYLEPKSSPLAGLGAHQLMPSCPSSLNTSGFEVGNGINSDHEQDQDRSGRSTVFEGPVTAIMHLTHSADAYDRTSIVVEKSLRLPPRQDASECGRWVNSSEMPIPAGNRSWDGSSPSRKLKCQVTNLDPLEKGKNRAQSSQETCELSITRTTTTSFNQALSFPAHGSLTDLQQFRNHEECEDEDDESSEWRTELGEDEAEPDDQEDDEVGLDTDAQGDGLRGFGKWSRKDVFDYDDALGGF
ncbi:hypothetical protein CROQUDRAFT_549123 [Cronartium quercuum f. sp. fusiforme G11]|uniref:Uncharacterized protein n=1 Tax=Cronartium quercuum f. sp. fusiforme G11 TaxID=708437 RepID=A0A9P6NKQ9_9BASI|nr:hypothetical protein CROQUDRAFT_549123 [Cronartium quercuum f. sp. fusiforme G11]